MDGEDGVAMGQEVARGQVGAYSFILHSVGLQNGFLRGNSLPVMWHARACLLHVILQQVALSQWLWGFEQHLDKKH